MGSRLEVDCLVYGVWCMGASSVKKHEYGGEKRGSIEGGRERTVDAWKLYTWLPRIGTDSSPGQPDKTRPNQADGQRLPGAQRADCLQGGAGSETGGRQPGDGSRQSPPRAARKVMQGLDGLARCDRSGQPVRYSSLSYRISGAGRLLLDARTGNLASWGGGRSSSTPAGCRCPPSHLHKVPYFHCRRAICLQGWVLGRLR